MYQDPGCYPGPDIVDPFVELSKREPLVAVAIRLAEHSGANRSDAHHADRSKARVKEQLSEVKEDLRLEKRDNIYLRNNLEAAQAQIRTLERKVPKTKKITKKVKK